MNEPLPPALNRRWGHLQYIRQRGPREWSSACPKCGDMGHAGREWPDRFRMFDGDKSRCWCRHCGYQDFADSDRKDFVITPVMRQAWIEERLTREEQEKQAAERAIELLRKESSWLHWHEQMPAEGWQFWTDKGVPEWAVKFFQLGWCPDKIIWSNSLEYHTPTATIPVFGLGWNLLNIRHRLVNPPDPSDKYRPDRAGIPQTLYLTDLDKPPEGECLIVEGEIKAIVLRSRIDNPRLSIVGIPGKRVRRDLFAMLDRCERIYICLDPDANAQAHDLAGTLGKKRVRIINLPAKPDDCFTQYGMTEQEFTIALNHGRVV